MLHQSCWNEVKRRRERYARVRRVALGSACIPDFSWWQRLQANAHVCQAICVTTSEYTCEEEGRHEKSMTGAQEGFLNLNLNLLQTLNHPPGSCVCTVYFCIWVFPSYSSLHWCDKMNTLFVVNVWILPWGRDHVHERIHLSHQPFDLYGRNDEADESTHITTFCQTHQLSVVFKQIFILHNSELNWVNREVCGGETTLVF